MKLTYVGPHDRVVVPLPNGGAPEVDHGGVIDIPDSHAERLLEQPTNWQRAGDAAKPKKDEIAARLVELGVEIPAKATKPELEQLLEDAELERAAALEAAELDAAEAAGGTDQTGDAGDSNEGTS